jgi:hypothetical protein
VKLTKLEGTTWSWRSWGLDAVDVSIFVQISQSGATTARGPNSANETVHNEVLQYNSNSISNMIVGSGCVIRDEE